MSENLLPLPPPGPRFQPIDRLARIAMLLLVVVGAADALVALSNYHIANLFGRAMDGGTVSLAEAHQADHWLALADWAAMAALCLAGIAFVIWFHRCYDNIEAIGGHRERSKGQAIWSWFVPILSWFRPKQIANEIAECSPGANTGLMAWWWGLFLLTSFDAVIVRGLHRSATTYSDFHTANLVDTGNHLLRVTAAVLAVFVVRELTRAQNAARTPLDDTSA